MVRLAILLFFAVMAVGAIPALLHMPNTRDGLVIFGSLFVFVMVLRLLRRRDPMVREWNERRIRMGLSDRR